MRRHRKITMTHTYCHSSVKSWLEASSHTGILNTCIRLWLTESEQATPVDQIKDVVRSSMLAPEFDKHLKKAGGHIGRNVVSITIDMKIIVRKPWTIKIIKLRLKKSDNLLLISKLATLVESDPKASFSIATLPRCRRGRYSIPWIGPL